MKTMLFSVFALLLCGLALPASAAKAKKSRLHHVVSFKFKDTATKEDIKKIEDAFRDLKTQIPLIASYEWGTNNSPEGLNKGFTHAFLLTFKTEKDRDEYLVHPDHKAFGALLKPFLADVMVIDFWSKD